jgi:orotidine-5'-phosphate decarboxylase
MTDLILALDVKSGTDACRIAGATSDYLDAIKIGYPLVLSEGIGIASRLSELGLPLIADFKVADIPNTSSLIAEEVFIHGFSAIICHGFVGDDSVRACVNMAHEYGGECYVVTEMSHPGATRFFHGGVAEAIAGLVCETGADGIIAPATRPERTRLLRSLIGDKKILSPGVGAQGGDPRMLAGIVDGIIVGRAIYDASDPLNAAERYAAELKIQDVDGVYPSK